MDKDFDLLKEPWIRVLKGDGTVAEVSLSDALLNAHTYQDLAGELPTQDVAILRQMLALLYSVFAGKDESGNERAIESKKDAFMRWKALWNHGAFPQEPLQQYFEKWKDRFRLFDAVRPFGQVFEAKIGTEYTSAKLNGELSESGNKARLFPARTGSFKDKLEFAEAARWLIYVNAFDDTSAKPKGKNLPSVGVGWLGKLGLIQACGKNLFQTLMLNLTFLRDGSEIWGPGMPTWELNQPNTGERAEIAVPENPAALYTLQSRRLLLKREDTMVTGFTLLGGDFFDRTNAFAEQMTVWSRHVEKKNQPDTFTPKRHDASRQMWRDLAAIISAKKDSPHGRLPGVVQWISALRPYLPDDLQMIRFKTASVQYGDKDFFVTDVFGDALAFHTDLLTNAGDLCREIALDEIGKCDNIAKRAGQLAHELSLAAGGDDLDTSCRGHARAELYHRLDEPFRIWLEALDPMSDDLQTMIENWRSTLQKIALHYGKELVDSAGKKAFVGRYITIKTGEKESKRYLSSPDLYNWYQYDVKRIIEKTEG